MFPGGGYGGGGYGGGYGGGGSYSSIPLDVKIPQFPSAAQYVGQMVSLQDAMARRQLTQAEVQNQNLLGQQRQEEINAQRDYGRLVAQNPQTSPQGSPPGAGNSMAAAVAPSGDFGGEAGAATPVPPVQTQSPEAAHAALTEANTFGNVQGFPMVNNQNVYQQLRAMGHGLYADKVEATQRANDTAALANHAEALKNQASATDQLAQIATPFVSTLRDPDSTPAQKSESYRNFRNAALQLAGPNGGKLLSAAQLPDQYTTEGPNNMGAASSWAPYLVDSNQKAQQIAGEQIAHVKALQEVAAGNVKAGEQTHTQALTLGATSNNADDIAGAVAVMRREGAKPQDIANNLSGFLVRNPDGTPMYAQDGFPLVQFSPQAKAQAQQALIPPQDQTRDLQGRLQMTGPLLATAFDKDQDAMGPGQVDPSLATPSDRANYTAARNQLAPDLKRFFPESPTDRDQIIRSGMTGTQTESAGARDERIAQGWQNADTRAYSAQTAAGVADLRSQLMQMKIDAGGDTHKTTIANLTNQALNDALNGGGHGVDDAIGNVSNAKYYQGAPIGQHRAEVLQALESMRGATARATNAENKEGSGDILGKFAALAGKNRPGTANPPAANPPAAQAPKAAPPATAPPRITAQAAYDALPSGTIYTGSDGSRYKKP